MILKQKIKKLKNNAEFKKILTNMNWLFLDKIIQMGIAFFVSVLVIRYLGPEQYGALSYAIAIVAFFSVFSKLGLDAITVRELVVGKIKKEELLGTVFYLKLLGGFLAVILSTITVFFLQDSNIMVLATIIISFSLIFQSTDVIDYWFQSRVISKHIAYSRSFAYITSAVIKIYLVSIGADLVWFVWVILIESIFIAIGFIIAYFRNKDNVGKWTFDKNISKKLLKDSWPLILSSISVMIFMRIDQIMIGNMLSYEDLGNYTVAVNLSEIWYFVPIIIVTSVFPSIIKLKNKDEKLYHKRLQKLYDIMMLLAVSMAIPIMFVSDWIIEFLYTEQYSQAGTVLAIYVWAGIFVFFGVVSSKYWITENLTKIALYITCFGAVINILLNMYLISILGIIGAALSTLISYFIAGILFVYVFKKARIIFKMQLNTVNIFRITKYLK